MKWNCVLFDLDGTLADTSQGIIHAIEKTIDRLGLEALSEEEKRSFIGPPIYESFKKRYDMGETLVQEATNLFRNSYKDEFLFEATLYAGIPELLQELKDNGVALGVATNKRIDYAMRLLEHLQIAKYFQCIQGSDFANTLKKPEIINECIEKMHANKNEVVLIGDTIHDYKGAMKSGIDFLAVGYGFGFETAEERKLIDSSPLFNNVGEICSYLLQGEAITDGKE